MPGARRGPSCRGRPRILGDTVRFAFVCIPTAYPIEITSRSPYGSLYYFWPCAPHNRASRARRLLAAMLGAVFGRERAATRSAARSTFVRPFGHHGRSLLLAFGELRSGDRLALLAHICRGPRSPPGWREFDLGWSFARPRSSWPAWLWRRSPDVGEGRARVSMDRPYLCSRPRRQPVSWRACWSSGLMNRLRNRIDFRRHFDQFVVLHIAIARSSDMRPRGSPHRLVLACGPMGVSGFPRQQNKKKKTNPKISNKAQQKKTKTKQNKPKKKKQKQTIFVFFYFESCTACARRSAWPL